MNEHQTKTPEEWAGLLERQEALEDTMRAWGRENFTRQVRESREGGNASMVGAAYKAMKLQVEKVSGALEGVCTAGGRGRPHMGIKFVKMCGYDVGESKRVEGWEVCAYIATRTIMDNLWRNLSVYHMQKMLGKNVLDEVRYRRLKDRAPGIFSYKMDHFKTSSHVHMSRSLRATMRTAVCSECYRGDVEVPKGLPCEHLTCEDLDVDDNTVSKIGELLLNAFGVSTGLMDLTQPNQKEVASKNRGKATFRGFRLVVPSKAAQELIDGHNRHIEADSIAWWPMLTPPLRWEPGISGGYRFGGHGRHKLVRGVSRAWQREIAGVSMPEFYTAINALQEVPYRINPAVWSFMREAVKRGGGVAGLPRLDAIEMPEPPVCYHAEGHGEKTPHGAELFKGCPKCQAWKKEIGKRRDEKAAQRVKVRGFTRAYGVAERFQDEGAFYYPWNADFRGRLYPIPDALHPQGDDISKGLLQYATGKPLGDTGAAYLALHGANCLGAWEGAKVSKMGLQERIDLVVGMTQEIIEVAEDPWGNRWWMDQDENGEPLVEKPLSFLAFCAEWAGYANLHAEGRGEEFVSFLPVFADGTCNGLQHYALMLRSTEDGERVNCVVSFDEQGEQKPSDVYADVATVAERRLREILEEGGEDAAVAHLWLSSGLLGRSTLKGPTMTYGYGSRRSGFQRSIKSWLAEDDRRLFARQHFQLGGSDARKAAVKLLADVALASIEEVVVAAAEGMRWFKDAARAVVRHGNFLSWSVPGTGFKVRQEYDLKKKTQIKCVIMGQHVAPVIYRGTKKPDTRKQGMAVAPNVVHSLDAACLQLTVAQATEKVEGMHMSMVHDSYGTHAADMGVLAQTLREVHAQFYEEFNVCELLSGEWAKMLPEATGRRKKAPVLPAVPERGVLDPTDLRNSDFFFS